MALMTNPPAKDSGPRFDRADEQARAHSGRLKLIIGIIVGPSIVLAVLGFPEVAASVLLISIACSPGDHLRASINHR